MSEHQTGLRGIQALVGIGARAWAGGHETRFQVSRDHAMPPATQLTSPVVSMTKSEKVNTDRGKSTAGRLLHSSVQAWRQFLFSRDYMGLLGMHGRSLCCGNICMYDTKGLSMKEAKCESGSILSAYCAACFRR